MLKPGNKILFISNFAGFVGGTEGYIYNTASLLKRNGFKPYSLFIEKTRESERFLSIFEQHWSFDEISQLNEKDFHFTTLHKISSPQILEVILKHFSPTVFVHDHDYYCPKGYKYYPYKRRNCKLAYHPFFCAICSSIVLPRHITNGVISLLKKNFIDTPKLFQLATSCKNFVVLSEFMKQNLLRNGISKDKIHLLHPFLKELPLTYSNINTNNKIQIVFAGQMVMSKGIPLLLDAISKLRSLTQKSFSVKIMGSGSRLEDFKRTSIDMGLGSIVEFLGWIAKPADIFDNSHIAVFSSLWQEPFGLSGIEAMSRGIPVVAFDVGGVPEWLKNNYNGILIPERDTYAMAKALANLIDNNTLRQTLGVNARKSVIENYTEEKFLKNFIQLA